MKNNLDIITDSGHEKISLVLKSLIVGIITSLVVILYRFSLSYAEKIAFNIYEYISENKKSSKVENKKTVKTDDEGFFSKLLAKFKNL